ncbi:hypothetical protein D9754_03030 [Planomicrobium sp. Y74]|nr:hypothetical protein D9754_03030 [Planomicrobium sp. Y74]
MNQQWKFQPPSQRDLRLEELAVGVWTEKSDNARLALTGIRQTNEVALAAQLGWLMTRRAGPLESGQRKAKTPTKLIMKKSRKLLLAGFLLVEKES